MLIPAAHAGPAGGDQPVAVATGLVRDNVATGGPPITQRLPVHEGSLSGSTLQLANLVTGVLIWPPFVLIANKIKVKTNQRDAFGSLLRRSHARHSGLFPACLDHNDDAGSLAGFDYGSWYDYRHGEGLFLEFQPQICSPDRQGCGRGDLNISVGSTRPMG